MCSGACSDSFTGWPGIAVPPGLAHFPNQHWCILSVRKVCKMAPRAVSNFNSAFLMITRNFSNGRRIFFCFRHVWALFESVDGKERWISIALSYVNSAYLNNPVYCFMEVIYFGNPYNLCLKRPSLYLLDSLLQEVCISSGKGGSLTLSLLRLSVCLSQPKNTFLRANESLLTISIQFLLFETYYL